MAMTRPRVEGMDNLINHKFEVLDHGFIRVVDYMGDDAAIVQAARVSYGTGTKTVSEDENLIRYLMRNRHTTPFEMCEIKLHVKLPIFVARQWIRHRTASVNEYSARYSEVDREFYVPEPSSVLAQSNSNKQGRGDELSPHDSASFLRHMSEDSNLAFDTYENALRSGVARELARVSLPLGSYTQWYWKIDLHNLLHFLSLRADPHAQWEIRQYAEVMLSDILPVWVPMVARAFTDYKIGATTLSAQELTILKTVLNKQDALQDVLKFERPAEMSDREMNELIEKVCKVDP